MSSSRRRFVQTALGASVLAALGRGAAGQARLPATPACGAVTPPQTPGPYFKPSSPLRVSLLEPDMRGRRVVLTGVVRDVDCGPVPRALLDFWQADAGGRYDTVGHRLRGHQFTDAEGHYRLETVLPGMYPGRTRHIHVRAQASGRPPLTTQLYFPGEPGNRSDALFDPGLVVTVTDGADVAAARFDFVLDLTARR
jgi:protocatechuate 3,4-dioxygenase beta subunit